MRIALRSMLGEAGVNLCQLLFPECKLIGHHEQRTMILVNAIEESGVTIDKPRNMTSIIIHVVMVVVA
jgi:hypothetical protein